MFDQYGGSSIRLLQEVYPEVHWEEWKFVKSSKGSWANRNKLVQYMNALSNTLRIQKLEDWYRVSSAQVSLLGGFNMIKRNGGLLAVLRDIYPQYQWKTDMFTNRGKKATQRWLKLIIAELFPECGV